MVSTARSLYTDRNIYCVQLCQYESIYFLYGKRLWNLRKKTGEDGEIEEVRALHPEPQVLVGLPIGSTRKAAKGHDERVADTLSGRPSH
jgi:hypothetical protein